MTPNWLVVAQQASLPTFALAALLFAAVAVIKVWPRLRELQISGDTSLRSDLMARIGQLETRVADLEKLITRKEAEHAVEVGDLEHELGNERQCVDAFILLMETAPEKAPSHLEKVKAMRDAHRERVALRRGAREGTMLQEGPKG